MSETTQQAAVTVSTTPQKYKPKKFVYADAVFEALELAYDNDENVVLYGPGGFAKSEMAMTFFERKGIVPYIKSLGAGTTIDSLLGGLDVNLFMKGEIDEVATAQAKALDINAPTIFKKKEGSLEYLVENSFMNHEYVILEEAFDAPDFVLEIFKDILTAKCFRNGSQMFPIKTKMIVVCTNRERNHVVEDSASLKALMERFPYEIKVEWPGYTADNYKVLFKESFNEVNNLLAEICGELHVNKITISPRTAVKALQGFKKSGDRILKFIADFNSAKAKEITKSAILKYKSRRELEEIVEKVSELFAVLDGYDLTKPENFNMTDMATYSTTCEKIKIQVNKLDSIKKEDDMVKQYEQYKKDWSNRIEDATNRLQDLITNLGKK